ncbi:TPA: hypothetical protein EYP38_05575 [Candidatus Micrarchaeota archaeon]|nr:hypothetical protein [Candidatus Micrarchaeota archaeon]
MKETEVKLTDEGFEEVTAGDSKPGYSSNDSGSSPSRGGNRPDFRIVQPDRDKDGNPVYVNVGGMWKNISKSGNTFYTLKIGTLKLLVFENKK